METGKLGNAIRMARMEKHLSQEELAEMVGITPTHLKHIESEHRKPSLEVLWKLVLILHISLDNLVFPKPEEKSTEQIRAENIVNQLNTKQLRAAVVVLDEILKL